MERRNQISKNFAHDLVKDGVKLKVWNQARTGLSWNGAKCKVTHCNLDGMITIIVEGRTYFVHQSTVQFQVIDDEDYKGDIDTNTIAANADGIQLTVKKKKKKKKRIAE